MKQILRFGIVDSQGDIFHPGDFEIKNPIKVTDGSYYGLKGFAKVTEEIDGLYADFSKCKDVDGLIPTIGYQLVSNRKYKLQMIALTLNPNIDTEITKI